MSPLLQFKAIPVCLFTICPCQKSLYIFLVSSLYILQCALRCPWSLLFLQAEQSQLSVISGFLDHRNIQQNLAGSPTLVFLL